MNQTISFMASDIGMVAFHVLVGERAWRETRSVRVFTPEWGLPVDEYGFVEHYCVDPKCDCRRVILGIVRKGEPGGRIAMVNFGWETPSFYARWMGADDEVARDMAGASLEPFSMGHPLADAALRLTKSTVLQDADYVARLQRHYREFKQAVRRRKGRLKRPGLGFG